MILNGNSATVIILVSSWTVQSRDMDRNGTGCRVERFFSLALSNCLSNTAYKSCSRNELGRTEENKPNKPSSTF